MNNHSYTLTSNTGFQSVVVSVDVPPSTTGIGTMTVAQNFFTILLNSTQTVVTVTIPVPVATTPFGVQFAARNGAAGLGPYQRPTDR